MKKIRHCLGCHELLAIGKNITENYWANSDYKCKYCRTLQAGGFCKSLTINKQFAHGMKQHRVALLKQIDSYTGRVGRPPLLLAELKLFLKALNKSIKKHDK